jgi:hypothetical protein
MIARLRTLARLLIERWSGPLPPASEDPRIGVRQPLNRRPGGRSSAIALDEPPEWSIVEAPAHHDLVGGSRSR